MKKLLYVLLALIAALLIAIFVVSEKYHYEKSIVINAPAEKVYSHISSTRAFNEWNPWLKLNPDMKVDYYGVQGKIGDRYCWDSVDDDAGAGCQEIVELVPNQKQKTRMEFKRPFEDTSHSEIILSPQDHETKVTWTLESDLERPMNLMKPLMNHWMGKSYGEGLAKLKELAENN